MSTTTVTSRVAHEGLDADDEYVAGGTDVVTLLRSGIHRPAALVSLKGDVPVGVDRSDGGWRIGAGTTLSMIEDDPELHEGATTLTMAAREAATRQIRNRATVGGNLLQRSRCSYYRDPTVNCWLKGDSECPARSGLHAHHALVESGPCITTHPSDLASALVALGATVTYELDAETVTVPVDQLLVAPSDENRRLHCLPHGALLRYVDVPRVDGPSIYLKAMDRAAWQFALVGVAAVRHHDDVTVVVSGVASTPHRMPMPSVARAVDGEWTDEGIRRAAESLGDDFSPGPHNRYKIPLLRGLLQRALDSLA